MKREIRFYVCLVLGFVLIMYGAITPPPGEVTKSLLIAGGMFLCVGAVAVGVDVIGIIHELTELRKTTLELLRIQKDEKKNNE